MTGQDPQPPEGSKLKSSDNSLELLGDEDGKTVEDLLAELGPEESWQVGKNEQDDIENLLKSAKSAVGGQTVEDSCRPPYSDESKTPETESNGRRYEAPEHPEPTEEELDREADEYVAQILEEIKHAPERSISEQQRDDGRMDVGQTSADNTEQPVDPFPTAPIAEPDPPSYSDVTADDALASRFANLGLPSVPTIIKSPASQPKANPTQTKGFTDEEIDSWCIICNEDATLSCVGCDGDLYCTNCWLDGHKGPDAGIEERTHKAVQYNKGGGVKKQPARGMLGA